MVAPGEGVMALVRELAQHPWRQTDVDFFVGEYARGERLSAARLREHQAGALRRLLWRCLLDVPAYLALAPSRAARIAELAGPEDLASWPIQRAAERLQSPARFRAVRAQAQDESRARRAAVERRAARWAGSPPATLVTIEGDGAGQVRPDPRAAIRLAAALRRTRDVVISAPASALAWLADGLLAGTIERRHVQLRALVVRGHDATGRGADLARTLSIPLLPWIGCDWAGLGLVAAPCEQAGPPHVFADHLLLEVVDETGAPLPLDTPGRLLGTDLHDHAAPVLRLELGMHGRLLSRPCACGRALPLLELSSPPPPAAADGGRQRHHERQERQG